MSASSLATGDWLWAEYDMSLSPYSIVCRLWRVMLNNGCSSRRQVAKKEEAEMQKGRRWVNVTVGRDICICFSKEHKSFAPYYKETPRICIILPFDPGKIFYIMTHLSNRDMITVRCNITDVVLCSPYLGHEPNKPEIGTDTVRKMSKLVEFTNQEFTTNPGSGQ